MTLTEFLLARYAEDEADARAALEDHPAPWSAGPWREEWMDDDDWAVAQRDWASHDAGDVTNADGRMVAYDEGALGRAAALHVARHHPGRVLADCDAKRRILERCGDLAAYLLDSPDGDMAGWSEAVYVAADLLRALALPYADHPDYNPEWRP